MPPPVPAAIRSLAGDDDIRAVWLNGAGGLTFEFTAADATRRFAKWAPAGCDLDFTAERERLEWAARFAAVPRVLGHGSDQGSGSSGGSDNSRGSDSGDDSRSHNPGGKWMLTAGLPGDSAVSASFQSSPARRLLAVQGIARGLRMLHDALPVEDCPFSWSVAARVSRARASGVATVASELEALVERAPSVDRLVVCHGDACAPNTLLADDGAVTGHVDLGALGVADRWSDIAVAAWSTEWNYGPGYEQVFLEAYGVDPDDARMRFYRTLWDAT